METPSSNSTQTEIEIAKRMIERCEKLRDRYSDSDVGGSRWYYEMCLIGWKTELDRLEQQEKRE